MNTYRIVYRTIYGIYVQELSFIARAVNRFGALRQFILNEARPTWADGGAVLIQDCRMTFRAGGKDLWSR